MKRIGALLLACLITMSLAVPSGAAPMASTPRPESGFPVGWMADHPLVPRTFSNMGPRSLAIDSDDHLYLAYGGDHLYYTHNEGSGWATPEVVDPDLGVGQGASLALDSAKKVHISYVDTAQGGLRYATNTSGSWVVTTLLTSGDIDPHTALALDTNDRPHILYHVPSVDSMGYYYLQADGTWAGYGVNYPGDGGGEVSLAIGSDNVLQTSFYETKSSGGGQGCLMYQVKNGVGWQDAEELICGPLSGGGDGSTSAIALDSLNHPHIAFNNTGSLGYYYYTGTQWAYAFTSGGDTTAVSIVMDGSNRAHISYKANAYLRYVVYDSGAWSYPFGYIDNGTGINQYNSLVLDSGGLPHITYINPANGRLLARQVKNSSWQAAETIDTVGSEVGRCTSLAFLPNGTTYLTYFDAAAKQIKFAAKLTNGTWNLALPIVTADAPGPVYCQHSLALKNTVPAVAYTTEAGELRYAEYGCVAHAGCSWVSSHVSDIAWLPESVSLRFNSLDKPRISFNENVQATLAYNDGAGWNLSQIDPTASSGQTSLAIGNNDKAYIAYFLSATHDLYYAEQKGTSPVTWYTPSLVDGNNVGTYVSLTLNSINWGNVAYTGLNGATLRYNNQTLLGWQTAQTLDGYTVESPSIMLDSSGQPSIFYYSGNDGHLHQSFRQGTSWKFLLLDNNALVGRGLSLAISPLTGKPALGYFDENVSGLKYLYGLDLVFLPLLRK